MVDVTVGPATPADRELYERRIADLEGKLAWRDSQIDEPEGQVMDPKAMATALTERKRKLSEQVASVLRTSGIPPSRRSERS